MSSLPSTGIQKYFVDLINDPNSLTELKQFAIALSALTITCAVFYSAYYDADASTGQFYKYAIFGILPVFIGLAIISKIANEPNNLNMLYLYGTMLFILICAVYAFYRIMNPTTTGNVYYFMNFMMALVLLIGLAIVYRIFVRIIVNMRGWVGFVLRLIFILPCLLIELLETIVAELKSTSKMVITLFIIELIIILAYLYIQRSANSPPSKNSTVLLDKPEFLSSLNVIGQKETFRIPVNNINNPGKEDDIIPRHYSISMWIYINQHPSSNAAYSKETNVFRYGHPAAKGGHPRVTYFNNTNDPAKSDQIIVYVSNQLDSSGVSLSIPAQSWNQLVISYTETGVNIFLNGDLEKTVELSIADRPKYQLDDIAEVGEGDNTVLQGGLHGAICNVVYYTEPLTAFNVASDYNRKRYSNPPTHS
jgi:hypothetical protein